MRNMVPTRITTLVSGVGKASSDNTFPTGRGTCSQRKVKRYQRLALNAVNRWPTWASTLNRQDGQRRLIGKSLNSFFGTVWAIIRVAARGPDIGHRNGQRC